MDLQGKTIMVTGAAKGIGRGISEQCAAQGANVVLCDINPAAAEETAAAIDGNHIAIACDVSKSADRDAAIQQTLKTYGCIDGLVNNAGVYAPGQRFIDTDEASWDHVMNVDLKAVFFFTQAVAKVMLTEEKPSGSIVNIASVHATASFAGDGPYDAAKCGVVGLSKSIAIELASQGIRVNVVSPGLIETEIWKDIVAEAKTRMSEEEHWEYWRSNIPMDRLIQPKEVGDLCAFLLSDRASAITGTDMVVDAGMCAQLISTDLKRN